MSSSVSSLLQEVADANRACLRRNRNRWPIRAVRIRSPGHATAGRSRDRYPLSTTPDKEAAARAFGAHHFVSTHDQSALESLAGTFDMVLDTVNADLPWDLYVQALAPKGKLHVVEAAQQMNATIFPMLVGQRSIGESPLGSPATIRDMLRFAARHRISPQTEHFPLSEVNEAMEHLRPGRPRYRIVLDME